MKYLRNLSRILVGIVFIFSGFVKVVDPLGSSYKFTDYFFAMNLEFLGGFSLFFAISLSVIELLLGICLFFNLIPKLTAWILLIFMLFFTPITLWLAISNPVTDCGCFGDALTITNWQTFYKNVVILALTILIFSNRHKFQSMYSFNCQLILALMFLIGSVYLSIFCFQNLPIIDFRAYHIGANIKEGMIIPESEKDNKDIFESSFIYEKDGVEKEFSIENIPDESWKFIDAKHTLIKEGYRPPIQNFSIEPIYISGYNEAPETIEDFINLFDAEFLYVNNTDTSNFTIDNLPNNSWDLVQIDHHETIIPENIEMQYLTPEGETINIGIYDDRDESNIFLDAIYMSDSKSDNKFGVDIKDQILSDTNYTFLAIILNVSKADTEHLYKLNQISEYCKINSYNFLCLTASNEDEIKDFILKFKPNYNFYNTDPITLKTIVRSNPGLLLLKEGTILDKWASRNIPEVSEFQTNLSQYSITKYQKTINRYIVYIYILSLFLVMSLITSLYYWLIKNRYINKY